MPQAGKAKRLIILTNVPDPFWDTCEAGAKAAEADLKLADAGLRVVVEQNTDGVQGQIQRLREWAGTVDVAGVAVSVTEPDNTALIDALQTLKSQGVKIVTIDSDIDRTNPDFRGVRYGYIGTDNIQAGQELGKAAAALLPQGGTFAAFVGNKTQANAIQRNEGFVAGAGSKFQQVDFLGDGVDLQKAQENVRGSLARHPDVKLMVGLWAYNPPAIASVIQEQKLGDRVTVVGFDAAPLALSAMEQGRVQALLVQNPYDMGYASIKTLNALLNDDQTALQEIFPNHDAADGDVHETGLKVVVPVGSPLNKAVFRPETEFLNLEQFQAWLKKYQLSGS